ncbi:hypothetical protein [Paraflavitalea speifideaquila]|uniref:hypothetical protein n=1 Tax=Paraflavitalea speifideaquila TaxID=3076558 RepID=UPI0028E34A4B|nr:hypothetical protein [Paraflavitalea speifideiaquila]
MTGANYIPANAINQLEMWQAATFDPATIDKELGWAESIGFNTMRVFLHSLAWKQDPEGFKKRVDEFLVIAAKHHIEPMFVFFDDCWNKLPRWACSLRLKQVFTIRVGCRTLGSLLLRTAVTFLIWKNM